MGRRADVPHAVILALLAAAPGSACAGPAVPEEAPMISSSQDPQLRLYEGRLRRTGVPLEMASVPLDAVSLGATASSAWNAPEGVEVLLLVFPQQAAHPAAMEAIRQVGSPEDVRFASSGGTLLVLRGPAAQKPTMTRLASAFAGQE